MEKAIATAEQKAFREGQPVRMPIRGSDNKTIYWRGRVAPGSVAGRPELVRVVSENVDGYFEWTMLEADDE